MIGADLMILMFGLGLMALAGLIGREAMTVARAGQRNRTILFGIGTVVFGLAGFYCVVLAVLRLFQT